MHVVSLCQIPAAMLECVPHFVRSLAPDGSAAATRTQFLILDHVPTSLPMFLRRYPQPLPYHVLVALVADLLAVRVTPCKCIQLL